MPTSWQWILRFISALLALLSISNSFYQNFTCLLWFVSTYFPFLLSKLHFHFSSVSCPLPPLFSSLLSDLCFVPNSMWLSLMPGSNVPVWVSLTVSKKEERCLITQWGDICNALEGKLSHFGHKLWFGCHHGLCFSKRKSIWTNYLLFSINLHRVVSMTRLNLAHNHRDEEDLMCLWFSEVCHQ